MSIIPTQRQYLISFLLIISLNKILSEDWYSQNYRVPFKKQTIKRSFEVNREVSADYQNLQSNNYESFGPKSSFVLRRNVRDLQDLIAKTAKTIPSVRRITKAISPSAAQIGFDRMRKMVKRQQQQQQLQQFAVKPYPLENLIKSQTDLGVRSTMVGLQQAPTMGASSALYNYNYQQYPGYESSQFYPQYNLYGAMPYPFYGSSYFPQFQVTKRMFLPYATSYSDSITSSPSQFQYPYSNAYARAYITNMEQQRSSADQISPLAVSSISQDISNMGTASGISQGLIDLENDVNGFNQAIQYMKEAFISQNIEGDTNLSEKLNSPQQITVGAVKKDLVNKQKKSSAQLLDAYKKTLESKNRLENKLVNYFTNYVCGDDC